VRGVRLSWGQNGAIYKAQEEANDEWKQLKKAGHCDQLYLRL
jgi:hypothetical protein